MESRRMPFPTTRLTSSDVGATRNQGSDLATCTHPQVSRLLWCREFNDWQVCQSNVHGIQCRNVQRLPQKVIETPFSQQAHGDRAGQRPLPSRRVTDTLPAQVPRRTATVVLAAVQSATRADRTCLEARSPNRYAQSIFRDACRSARGRRSVFRLLAKT
jgi:hypothetical protein